MNLFANLTAAQEEAVRHVDGPLLVLAGPGSGKTRVVTHRVAHLLSEGVGAHQILALTFTNKAADEMKRRVEELAPGRRVWMGTFHRYCAMLLRQHAAAVGLDAGFSIYDTLDSTRALKQVIESARFEALRFVPDQIQRRISWAKNNLISPEMFEARAKGPLDAVTAQVYPAYQQELLKANAVDFDDLLLHVAMLLESEPEVRATLDSRYRYVMVDEYQDTNLAQYGIVRALSHDFPNLAATGDPDQSIYGWRGANLSNILEFEEDFPDVKVVRLEQNYRSTKRILSAAGSLIRHNERRKEKLLFTENAEGEPVRYATYQDHRDEAQNIAGEIQVAVQAGTRRFRDFAVFYRANALSRSLEQALREAGVPFQMVNGLEFYQRKEIKDLVAYLRLLCNPRDNVAFRRVINTPARGIGKATLERLTEHSERYGLSMLDAARESGMIESLPKRSAVKVAKFVTMFDAWQGLVDKTVEEILAEVIAKTQYKVALELSELEEDQQRIANIEELLTAAREFDEQHGGSGGLEDFLEEASLVNETDAWEVDEDRATLMTLHASKGLEFPVVYIVAVEEKLIPHERSKEDAGQLEEERRLLFVGMTRAKELLRLSRATYRTYRGQRRMSVPSLFLMELPIDELLVEETEPSSMTWGRRRGTRGLEFDDPYEGVDDYVDDEAEESAMRERRSSGGAGVAGLKAKLLKTGAELEAEARATELSHEQPAARGTDVPPEVFEVGMMVRHPEYGVGKILDMDGRGGARRATVQFVSAAGKKRFVLKQSPLRPAR